MDTRPLIILMIVCASLVNGQDADRCQYMINIPREPKPDDLPILDFEGVPWSERPFLPGPEREDVCMDEYLQNSASQIIFMDEEIIGDVPIAELNYKGPATPSIDLPLTAGSFHMLGPELRKENNAWILYITQRQDFETPEMTIYMLSIRIEGESLVGKISLSIVNIDDNPPIIHLLDSCIVPELGEPRLTSCSYEVTDEDGRISTSAMTFKIDSERDDDSVFYILGDPIENDWKRMNMIIGLQRPLDFEANALHIFSITAFDSLPNNHTVTLMVQVQNIEHRPPRWIEIFAVQQLNEKTARNFTVRAIDGDTGINKPIHYRIDTAEGEEQLFAIETLEGGHSGAIFQVFPIDRDYLQRELYQVTLTAYKYDNASFSTSTNLVIIVIDINDQIPEPLYPEYNIVIPEETPQTLYFDKEFGFHDKDLGKNAQYKVHLESVFPPEVANAFFIQPETGYQKQTFIMGTTNHSILDFELPEFQKIQIKVIATDLDNPEFVGVATVNINLTNWNDELPIFKERTQTVTFNETEGEGFRVGQVLALDRDIDDIVIHSIMGNAKEYLQINNETGEIVVSRDNSFDYHRQNEILVQVLAEDTLGEPYNTATSQLIIQLKDINNTPPSLRLPRGSTQVQENVLDGFIINDEAHQFITATDPDTTADLVFEIIWETSYAMKRGAETDKNEIEGCLEIVTSYPNGNRGEAVGRLVVREIRPGVTIDYEMFEVLYITIRVNDTKTVFGDDYDELTFTITILDMNDNPPVWVTDTLEQTFRVREKSSTNTVLGSVIATDADGPLYNQVRYTIVPRENTPPNLVKIDFESGQLAVDAEGAIDADEPRERLHYTVLATDRCQRPPADCGPDTHYFVTEGDITIQIIDTNDRTPLARTDKFKTRVEIYENASNGEEVVTLVAEDGDRDGMYHSIRHQINYGVNMRLNNFFAIDPDSGRVYVHYTTHEVLDRDGNEPTHKIFFTLIDNFNFEGDGNRNQNVTDVEVILLDINDNPPELPSPEILFWHISEKYEEVTRLSPHIFARDRDEPNSNNSRVGYEITSLTITNRDINPPELFKLIHVLLADNFYNVSAELETVRDLKGYWGNYNIDIRAFDHGDPEMNSTETYQIIVTPYNFNKPKFIFPLDGVTLRLSKERAAVNTVLVLASGALLQRVQAYDPDGLQAGEVTFEVVGVDQATEYFRISNEGDNTGTLLLKQPLPAADDIIEFQADTFMSLYMSHCSTQEWVVWQIRLRATDGDPEPLSSEASVRAVFVPTQAEPKFLSPSASVAFFEKEVGLTEIHQLPLAEDPKNYLCEEDCHDIFYAIVGGNAEDHFKLDGTSNKLSLRTALLRSESASHVLRVAASNQRNLAPALGTAQLTVTVTVRESNPRPYFVRPLYTAGISMQDSVHKELLTVAATHSEGAVIAYTIDYSSMTVDPSLANVKNSAFNLNPSSGLLTLNIQPTASMQGMFVFNVVATDPAEATDTVVVKIYVISAQNRIIFSFLNGLVEVEQQRDFIAVTFGAGFNMTCNIDQVVPAVDSAGAARDDLTDVRAHFIRDDEPVTADVIEGLRGDTSRLRQIQRTLSMELLVLQDLVTGTSPTTLNDGRVLLYALAAVAGLLLLLLLVMLGLYFWRTGALNRRLQVLSMTRYGSQESKLNRLTLAAPGTNKHATEGSNPIWNEAIRAPDFDAVSEMSDDSDLVGIENLDQFREDYIPSQKNQSPPQGIENTVATHENNFGFNSTPFSKEFSNSPFRQKM